MSALRGLLLLAAVAVLPSCGDDHDRWLWVSVRNDGAVSANVWTEAEYSQGMGSWSQDIESSVAPGETVKILFKFNYMIHLTVLVHRSSDDMIIFYESWNEHDLRHVHTFLEITVTP